MKRIVLPLLFLCFTVAGYSQSLKKVNKYLEDKDYSKALPEITGYLEKKPDDMEAIYLKSKIYAGIADSAALHSLVQGDARAESFTDFKKAIADSANMKLKLLIMKDNYQTIFSLYSGYYQAAVDDFNKAASTGDKAYFKGAMENFIKADNVGQYISENEWAKIGKVDTTLVLNIGKAAINAKEDEIALKYFTKLAEAKIKGPKGQEDEGFKLPYEWLELHYKDAGDEAQMKHFAELGNEMYPKEPYFNFVMMDYYRDKKDIPKVLELYKDVVTENPDSIRYHFSYANEIFGYLYNSDEGTVIQDKQGWLTTLKSELDKAIALNPNDINSNWLTSQYFYNKGIELRDSALKQKDMDARNKMNDEAKANWNKAIPFADKAISELDASGKKSDRSRYKSVVNLMQNIYQSLGDKVNLKKYEDMYDAADKKFESRT